MKLDLPMLLLYAAVIGVGVWLWGLFTDNGNGNGNGSTVTLTTPTVTDSDGAVTTFGGWIDQIQEATSSDGIGSTVIDTMQGWFR